LCISSAAYKNPFFSFSFYRTLLCFFVCFVVFFLSVSLHLSSSLFSSSFNLLRLAAAVGSVSGAVTTLAFAAASLHSFSNSKDFCLFFFFTPFAAAPEIVCPETSRFSWCGGASGCYLPWRIGGPSPPSALKYCSSQLVPQTKKVCLVVVVRRRQELREIILARH
jgi:hypothetical protein